MKKRAHIAFIAAVFVRPMLLLLVTPLAQAAQPPLVLPAGDWPQAHAVTPPSVSAIPPQRVEPQAGREVVFLFNWSETHWVVGNVVPLNLVNGILFLKESCPLDIVGASNMRRAWHFHDVGCWAPTTDGGYLFASSVTHNLMPYPSAIDYSLHGNVLPDGNVLITEPGFDSLTWVKLAGQRVNTRTMRQIDEMRNARP